MNQDIENYIINYMINRVSLDLHFSYRDRILIIGKYRIKIPQLVRKSGFLSSEILNHNIKYYRYAEEINFTISDDNIMLTYDIIGEIYDHLTLQREISENFDLLSNDVLLPVLDMKIYKFFKSLQVYIPFTIKKLNNKPFFIGISHDIDRTGDSYLYRLITYFFQAVKQKRPFLFFKGMLGKNEEFNFEEILEIEESVNAKSTWFILSRYGLKKNADYKLNNKYFNKAIHLIQDKNNELGLHIPFMALSVDNINNELKKLPVNTKKGVRMHHLRGEFKELMKMLNDSEIEYDSTFGFNEVMGYRFGTSQPFHPIVDDKILSNIFEIPLNIMDLQIEDFSKFQNNLKVLYDILEVVGGCCIINWHNNRFNVTKYGDIWLESFKHVLNEGKRRNAWIGNLEEIVSFYKKGLM